jgi:hypothetical protein
MLRCGLPHSHRSPLRTTSNRQSASANPQSLHPVHPVILSDDSPFAPFAPLREVSPPPVLSPSRQASSLCYFPHPSRLCAFARASLSPLSHAKTLSRQAPSLCHFHPSLAPFAPLREAPSPPTYALMSSPPGADRQDRHTPASPQRQTAGNEALTGSRDCSQSMYWTRWSSLIAI